MKKLIAPEPNVVAVEDVPVPEMGPDDVLVRSVRSLISPGSELKRIAPVEGQTNQTWPNPDLGYAICGVVIDRGRNVTRFDIGDRVATMQNHQELVISPSEPGPVRPTIRIPDPVSWDDAPFILWGRSCWNWIRKADIQIGETVAVVGLGLVGLLMTMWAQLRGPARIIGLDLHDTRLDMAQRIGADDVVNPLTTDAVQAVRDLTSGGADVVFHCVSGDAVQSFELTQQITRAGGRVVLLGHHSRPLTILFREFTGKDLLGGNTDYDYDNRYFELGADLIARGRLPVGEIVTHNVHFAEASGIYEMLRTRPHEAAGVLLRWGDDG
ncbi:MAG: zinc-binding dehydrogenase [Armatimonadetes bacterium]|nr:zinc-binding dehydrogenase [Armatimonadota bacterium]